VVNSGRHQCDDSPYECRSCGDEEDADRQAASDTYGLIYSLICLTVGHGEPVECEYRLQAVAPLGREWQWATCRTCGDVLSGVPCPQLLMFEDTLKHNYPPEKFIEFLERPSPFWSALNG
jgi:hypothetical protein